MNRLPPSKAPATVSNPQEVAMNKRVAVRALAVGLAAIPLAAGGAAQTRQEANARLISIVQGHLRAGDRVSISADMITLTGDTLQLTGNAWVRFGDGAVRADEAVINQATRSVDLRGNLRGGSRVSGHETDAGSDPAGVQVARRHGVSRATPILEP
jgi:O-acetylhomoserine/O-acetylserine sulfhydrylase-like pyridoxal-dependent enzyme